MDMNLMNNFMKILLVVSIALIIGFFILWLCDRISESKRWKEMGD
jgi:hypothetical protein